MEHGEYNALLNYLATGAYPDHFQPNDKRRVRKKVTGEANKDKQRFVLKDKRLYYVDNKANADCGVIRMRLVMKDGETQKVMKECHELSSCHLGRDRTKAKIQYDYYWPTISKDICDFIRTCDACQRTNYMISPDVPEMTTVEVPRIAWRKVAMDLIGPFLGPNREPLSKAGYKYILTLQCYTTKWPEAFALKTKTAEEVAYKLNEVLCRFGPVNDLISDNGGEFRNRLLSLLADTFNINQINISPYHPQANGEYQQIYLRIMYTYFQINIIISS